MARRLIWDDAELGFAIPGRIAARAADGVGVVAGPDPENGQDIRTQLLAD
ncbi:hypothetical protein ACVIGB_005358 [Bradyrhizobium sp. USDA 4341]